MYPAPLSWAQGLVWSQTSQQADDGARTCNWGSRGRPLPSQGMLLRDYTYQKTKT